MMQNYDREIEELRSSIIYAYQNWEIWSFIKTKKYNYKKAYNKYLLFFNHSEYAHWVTTIMSIWCLIDYKNLSLLNFYKELRTNNNLNANTILEVDKRLEGIKYIISGVTQIRHKIVAHISKDTKAYEVFDKVQLTIMDIRNIIVELGNILNIILDSIGVRPIAFTLNIRADKPEEIIIQNDIERLFADLENANL